ncbi:molybdenum ABC transporter ATP-binding protein [Maritimibacter dapengensis]|uniref:Molybdenum ABC transporter ATP-binding protein n=1 Tax=Maritimibacter dapengensis TaxID=2836868 RepID=A0ABS6T4U1_9RHOB|nr:molybdenum ABC transporter ATP-binding protein [Maritimibacter dapengensis]MBV7380174.1 molybdenum ABC transporter ATP-binding protein [Maritimibacter dapengensis]
MSLKVSIQHRLGDFALDVAFEAPPGVTVLFGRSGSGKTSVVNAVAGLMRPEQGLIELDGEVLQDRTSWTPPHRRRMGYVFQDTRLFPHLTVERNLAYGRKYAPKGANLPKLDTIVELLGIGALLSRRPADLSGGEKSRVAIGRALLSGPRLLLADEPLAALDDDHKSEILPYFERLRDELDVPVLYVSHSAAEVARLATTIIVLEQGHILRTGPAQEVLADPQITPLGPGAAGAMLEAKVVAHHADGLSELSAGSTRLLIPHVPCDPGQTLRVLVEAQDVMLAKTRPEGISALNVLAATIRDVRIGDGPGAMVQLDAGGNLMLARVTRRSVDALGLAPGQEIFAILKAVSVAREHLGKTRA